MKTARFKRHSSHSLLHCLAVMSAVVLFSAPARAADPLQVNTDMGKVEGALTTDQKVVTFKGIPFAAAPVGKLRWQAPQPAAKWNGVRPAKEFGSHCIQTTPYADISFRDPGASEDCLTLNVWAPAGTKPGSLPVMVWIYGGGFGAGGSSEPRQDGQFLAHRNVVVVSMNYRLGIFGFFVNPELTAESSHHASGNYGLLDQAAAIAWVKKNIKAFGGDPANITIFGESAGSSSVNYHMASPLSKDLIAKAIGESGGTVSVATLPAEPRETREAEDTRLAETAFGTSKLAELRALSADAVLAGSTSKTITPRPRFSPDVDGYFLPDSVAHIFAAGKQAHVPLIAGWNADESRGPVILATVPETMASFSARAEKDFGANAPQFLAAYAATTDAEAVKAAGDFAGDRFIEYSTWAWIEAQARTGGAPIFRYRLDLGSPGDRFHTANLGAFHSDDIEYVFGTLDSRPEAVWRDEDRKLSDQIGTYWTNFARTGDPNGGALPKWPAYAPPERMVMHLDATSVARPEEHRDRYLFLDGVWGAKN